MNINIVTGIGTGETLLSAFDSALKDAGVLNYNLIPLSSVIPPNTTIVTQESYITPESDFGHKLYVVKAEIRSEKIGEYLAAGIGWYQFGSDNRGVFVEHELIGDSREYVENQINSRIKNSLRDLCANRNIEFDEQKVGSSTSVTMVENGPTSVLVLSVYQAEGWR